MPRKNKARKRKVVSMQQYSNIMASIIEKGRPVSDTLIELLKEAGKYTLRKSK